MEDGVGSQLVKLDSVDEEKPAEKLVRRERMAALEERQKNDDPTRLRFGEYLRARFLYLLLVRWDAAISAEIV